MYVPSPADRWGVQTQFIQDFTTDGSCTAAAGTISATGEELISCDWEAYKSNKGPVSSICSPPQEPEKTQEEESMAQVAERLGIQNLNQLGTTSLPKLIGRGISILTGLVGAVALAVFVFGGFMWMLSMGNPERVKKAQGLLLWGGLGTMVILASYAIVTFLFEVF